MSLRPLYLLAALGAAFTSPATAGALAPAAPTLAERMDRLEADLDRAFEALPFAAQPIPAQWGWGSQPQQQQGEDAGVRLNALEGRMRQLNGQVEQLQFQLRRLEDQLRRFQEDTEFRFQEQQPQARGRPQQQQQRPAPAPAAAPPQQRGEALPGEPAPQVAGRGEVAGSALPPVAGSASATPGTGRPGPGAPPQTLGQLQTDRAGQPLDLAAGARGVAPPPPVAGAPPAGTVSSAPLSPPPASQQVAGIGGGAVPPGPRAGGGVAPPSNSPRDAYDMAYGHFLRGEYDLAEEAFQTYLADFPTDRNAGDALYWLGESHYQRRQWREAADAFLKSYTDFPQGGKAAESLLRLGMSMRQLGQTQAACASFGEVLRKYPRASQAVRQRVQTESRSAGCA